MKCDICKLNIKNEQQVYRLRVGEFKTDDDNCTGFEEGHYFTDKYVHFNCYINMCTNKKMKEIILNGFKGEGIKDTVWYDDTTTLQDYLMINLNLDDNKHQNKPLSRFIEFEE